MDKVSSSLSKVLIRKFAKLIECDKVIVIINMQRIDLLSLYY